MNYLIRMNCEYTIEVEASSPEEALSKAEAMDVADWQPAWAPMEIDEEGSGP